MRFARLGDQWPDQVLQQRSREGRPALTINKMPAFIRQVVNDARQMRPQIKVRPVDSNADPETAEVMNGLTRSIEQQSNADLAYDTAADFAVTMGFGYFRVDVDYAHDDTFDQDIRIKRIDDPFSVYADPHDRGADSSEWNSAFIVESMATDAFEARYKGAEKVDWDETGYAGLGQPWFDGEKVMVAEWWRREEAPQEVVRLTDGTVMDADRFAELSWMFEPSGITVVDTRTVKSHKVTHHVLTGAEVLETTEWAGRYIPIVPVYGEEINVEGRRYFRSLIRDAKDAQRMVNYWRSATTELVALAPKAPFIGPERAFDGKDARKWETANTENFGFLAYGGDVPPQRQTFAGVPAGALQEALNASDDMKAIMGLHDASLGARSNETSGKAIMARQREGDVSTFHFLDNLSRAIRHGGQIIIDLIPHVYSGPRIIRTMGWDGGTNDVRLGQPAQPPQQAAPAQEGQPEQPEFTGVFDLTVGKYDLVVEAGPSFTTQRQESAEQMMELLRVFPQAAPVIGDLLAKNLDWPGADEIAERLKALLPGAQGGDDPRLAQMGQMLQAMQAELEKLKADQAIDAKKVDVDAYEAETGRIKALGDVGKNVFDAMSPPGPYD
ncbi:MAG: portal protein [Alphaproteobacteria bacterium]